MRLDGDHSRATAGAGRLDNPAVAASPIVCERHAHESRTKAR